MIPRLLAGLGGGGAAGVLYGAFARCHYGACAVEWNPYLPPFVGAGLGLFVVLASKWD